MTYPSDFERKIDFHTVRDTVSGFCSSGLGRAECASMRFHTSFQKIKALLLPVEELTSLRRKGVSLPSVSVPEREEWKMELSIAGSMISTESLVFLLKLLDTASGIREWCNSGETESSEAIRERFGNIDTYPHLRKKIDSTIDRFGEIRDNASPHLAELSGKINQETAAMTSIVKGVIRAGVSKGILEPDTTASVRNGRSVIPVPAMSKRAIPGIVHDQSATGRTYFIEPTQAVEAGNRIMTLEIERKKEISRILIALAEELRPELEGLLDLCSKVGEFDFLCAKARFAEITDAHLPVLSRKPELEWYHAIHPVLLSTLKEHGKEAVPLDITLSRENRILVISGPNAGGKSVALKTVGMVQYMLQCGLLPPLYSNSHAGIFRNILVDIGDEQSLRDDLSTYSSHLRNMKYFLNHSDSDTLFLADEMGSGTEPQIGSALAQAILAQLGKNGAWGVVTTHYQNLKTFAESTPGFRNAAMLYDRSRLQPMFQLSIGNPGSSFALEIARKSGIPLDIIDEAKEIVGSDYVNMDKYLLDLTRDRKYWAEKRNSIRQKELRLDSLLEQTSDRAEVIKASRGEILAQARLEAKEILKGANAIIERTVREIKEAEAEKERTMQVRRELAEYASALDKDSAGKEKNSPKLLNVPTPKKKKKTPPAQQPKLQTPEAGMYVRLSDGGVVGKVLSVKGNKAEVAFGALRTLASLKDLVVVKKPKEQSTVQNKTVTKQTSEASRNRQLAFSRQLDLRGMRVDEALQAVVYFIDDAVQFSASQVRILHGTGTGALREAVRAQLASNPAVTSFRDEDVRFGGAGITVVELD